MDKQKAIMCKDVPRKVTNQMFQIKDHQNISCKPVSFIFQLFILLILLVSPSGGGHLFASLLG